MEDYKQEVAQISHFLQSALYTYRMTDDEYQLQWHCVREDYSLLISEPEFAEIVESQRDRLKPFAASYRMKSQIYRKHRCAMTRELLTRRRAGSTWDCIKQAIERLNYLNNEHVQFKQALNDMFAEIDASAQRNPD